MAQIDVEALYRRTLERNRGLLARINRHLEAIREEAEHSPGFEDDFEPEPPEPITEENPLPYEWRQK